MSFEHIQNGHDSCIVAFSSFVLGPKSAGSFSFKKEFLAIDGAFDLLLVKDPKNQWYNRKIEGMGDNVEEVTHFLAKVLERYSRVTMFGTSMGAYASMLFGSALGVDQVVAMSPQTFLAAPFPRFNPGIHSGQYVRLHERDLSKVENMDLIIGENELFDIYQANQLGVRQNIYLTIVPNAFHNVAYYWHQRKALSRVIAAIADGSVHEMLEQMRYRFRGQTPLYKQNERRVFRATIEKVIDARYHKRPKILSEGLRALIAAMPDWPGPRAMLGLAMLEGGVSDEAIDLLRTVRDENRYIDDIYRPLAKALASREEFDEALATAEQGASVNVSNKHAYRELVPILVSHGQEDLAKKCQQLGSA